VKAKLWVGIATFYGLDGPEIESRWRGNFSYPSRPAPRPNPPPLKWVPRHSRGIEQQGRGVDHLIKSSSEVKEGIEL